ncbi:MAG: metallophosphoesterase [Anaerolineae bacterium]
MPLRSPTHHRRYDIPPDRADGSSSLIHHALILTGRLGRIPPLTLLPLWVGLAALTGWVWQPPLSLAAAAGFVIFFSGDWAFLAWLPRTDRSWGPVTPPLLGLALVRALLFILGALVWRGPLGLGVTGIVNLVLTGVAFYATWIEPCRIQLTQETYTVSAWRAGTTIRVLHISDIHYEGLSLRERRLMDLVEEQAPDLIVLTGDYLNLSSVYDPEAQAGVRDLLGRFRAPYGVYAITGSPVVDIPTVVPRIFEGLPIQWLDDEGVEISVHGQTFWLLGVRNTYHEERDAEALTALAAATPSDAFRVLLYHTPDLMPLVAETGVDLYLCGHTHGGQIRLPLYGAVATSSRWGKRYEQGRYREKGTTLYVSRGLGLEGLGAPRARFLSPPEVILWEFRGLG